MTKMGRPKLPKGQHKEHFTTRFTRDELAQFTLAARRANLSLREWVTAVLTNAAK